jgi:hypothetical protein
MPPIFIPVGKVVQERIFEIKSKIFLAITQRTYYFEWYQLVLVSSRKEASLFLAKRSGDQS